LAVERAHLPLRLSLFADVREAFGYLPLIIRALGCTSVVVGAVGTLLL